MLLAHPFSPPFSLFVGSMSGLFACVHVLFIYIFDSLGQAMTTVAVHVDSKAELTTLLEQWEKEHGSGQDMVPILTRYEQLCIFRNLFEKKEKLKDSMGTFSS